MSPLYLALLFIKIINNDRRNAIVFSWISFYLITTQNLTSWIIRIQFNVQMSFSLLVFTFPDRISWRLSHFNKVWVNEVYILSEPVETSLVWVSWQKIVFRLTLFAYLLSSFFLGNDRMRIKNLNSWTSTYVLIHIHGLQIGWIDWILSFPVEFFF